MHLLPWFLLAPCVASALDVVIVGAGVSGLVAARTLIDNWPSTGDSISITVLEASSRLGGRTYTNYAATGWGTISGAEADIGASWIHGSNEATHPISMIAKLLSFATIVTENNKMIVSRCINATSCRYDVDDNNTAYKTLVKAAQTFANGRPSDMSMWDAMGNVTSVITRDDPMVQLAIGNSLEFEVGASPEMMSAWYYNNDKKMKGGGAERLIVKGYSQVSEALQAGTLALDAPCIPNGNPKMTLVSSSKKAIVVQFNKKVSSIGVDDSTQRVSVGTADGSTILADRVIVTVPLGVLKSKAITFSPPLPADKQVGIDKLYFGDVLKVGLLFNSVWWPDNATHYFGLGVENGGGLAGLRSAEKFTYFLNTYAAGSGRPVMMTFAFGASAMEVESWTDDQVWAAILANLQMMFRGEWSGVVVPTAKPAMWRSGWGTNNLFGGAYTSNAPGVTKTDWKNLARLEPHGKGKLLFAGEHTNHDYRGTVHGAFWSGQRAACQVLWPDGMSSVSAVAMFNTANPAAAASNAGFASGVDAGVAASAGVPASAVTVELSTSPFPVAPTTRRLAATATNRTLYVKYSIAVTPKQTATMKDKVKTITPTALDASITTQLKSTSGTDDDVDFDVDDMGDPAEQMDLEDPEADDASALISFAVGHQRVGIGNALIAGVMLLVACLLQ